MWGVDYGIEAYGILVTASRRFRCLQQYLANCASIKAGTPRSLSGLKPQSVVMVCMNLDLAALAYGDPSHV